MTITSVAENARRDLHYAFRVLRNNPGFAAVCILTIALGIGINVSAFTLLNAIALRPLHLSDADRLVAVYQKIEGKTPRHVWGNASLFSYPEYLRYRDQNRVFSGMLAYSDALRVSVPGVRETLEGALTTCNYFDVLGAGPAMGRGFSADECDSTASGAVVVLSDATWRNVFSADPAIIGKTIRLNQRPFTVAGVARADFRGTELTVPAFWTPVVNAELLNRPGTDEEQFLTRENLSWLVMIGRTREGASLRQVRASLNVIAAQIDARTPGRRTTLSIDRANLIGLPEERTAVLIASTIILCAIGMVLLTGCANLTNLMLARAAARRREIAVRLALGATRMQLVSQLLMESAVVCVAGGILGTYVSVMFSDVLLKTLIAHLPPDTPALTVTLTPDVRVYAYCLALMAITTLLVGLVPALQSTRPDLSTTLKVDDMQSARSGRSTMRSILVAAQVTMSALLLLSAGLLLHGSIRGQHLDPGFDAEHTAGLRLDLTRQGYDAAASIRARAEIVSRLRASNAVAAVAEAENAPLAGRHEIEEFAARADGAKREMEVNSVGPEYFSTLQIPLIRGRAFTSDEARNGAAVAIVPLATARALWPGEEALGKRLTSDNHKQYEVVGVTADTHSAYLPQIDDSNVYLPLKPEQPTADIILRFEGDYRKTANTVNAIVKSMDPNITYSLSRTADNGVTWLAPAQVSATISTILGLLALVLATIGIYGTIAYTVSRRVREICIRMVFGASSADINRLILAQVMRPVVVGAALGTVLSIGVAFLLRSLLFGVSAFDAASCAPVLLLLLGTAVLAAYLPARRASRLQPVQALHEQ
jgi:predicted permease